MRMDWYRGDKGCEWRKMRNKLALFGLVMSVFLIFIASISVASAATITVNDDGGADFTSIQDAINNASDGDSIEVWNGTYNENVDVNKRLTIYSRDGADVTVVQALSSSDHVFEVTADWVNISGFMVKDATGVAKAGIYLASGVDHSNISNNIASNNYDGIYLYTSSSNTLRNNTANSNNWCGIGVYYSSNNNTIANNTANLNDYHGIMLTDSPDNTLRGNTMTDNRWNFGVVFGTCVQDIDTSNKVDGKPIYYLVDQQDQIIDSTSNAGYVGIVNSANITVKDLTLTKNYQGVLFAHTNDSKIENVSVLTNSRGIYLVPIRKVWQL